MHSKLIIVLSTALAILVLTQAHVRVLKPASRSSIWRDEEFQHLNPPINYNDDAVWCVPTQQDEDISNCEPCGDEDNAAGGKYDAGIITGEYNQGQIIPVTVEFTTSHLGWVEFHICPEGESLSCLKSNLLNFLDGSSRYYVLENNVPVTHYFDLQLPDAMTCDRCVLEMTYHDGNNWGTCKNGTEGMGCGMQETFKNCMDISIH